MDAKDKFEQLAREREAAMLRLQKAEQDYINKTGKPPKGK